MSKAYENDDYSCPLIGKNTPENREAAAVARKEAIEYAKELDEKYDRKTTT